jgi:hypothetical protein
MSIKDLFGKKSNQILTVEKFEEVIKRESESLEYLEERNKEMTRFIPKVAIDFNDPKTFARYGSAEKYYLDSIERIINSYPYDGSLSEKTSWHNSNTYIDNYIFEKEYPRTTGYVSLNENNNQISIIDGYRRLNNPQFVFVKGGPNPTPDNSTNELKKQFPEFHGKSNILNFQEQRENNLYSNGEDGNTVEFWFKLNENRQEIDGSVCLFDLWNNQSYNVNNYSRFLIEIPEDKTDTGPLLKVTYRTSKETNTQGIFGVESIEIGSKDNLPVNFNINSWNHYAVTAKNLADQLSIKFYLNGNLIQEFVGGTSVTSFIKDNNHITASIGSLQHATSSSQNNLYGAGSVRGSFDELRYWKSARTSEQIGRFWISQVYGGTNTDESNVSLGIYFKFNEGIVDSTKIVNLDKQVIDYSGRISNGTIINYTISVRKLGSAINEKNSNYSEFKDPILYRDHPEIVKFFEDKKMSGRSYDMQNNAAIYNSIPEWITTLDDEIGGNNLFNITQIISSYFDTLHLQIESLSSLTHVNYVEEGEKPLPFAKHLLESVGLNAPEMFIDSNIFEALMNRDEKVLYEEKIYNVKNIIYQNIYNNIASIYKSKGTEKSFRNILRCFGIGDNLIKINLYGDGVKYRFEDNYTSSSVQKNFLDFNDPDRYDSTVYQQKQPNNVHSSSYIAGSENGELDYVPFTLEAAVIFPRKLPIDHPKYFGQDFGYDDENPSTIFGMHQAKDDASDLTWTEQSEIGFRVISIKEDEFSKNAKFRLDIRGMGINSGLDSFGYKNGILETEMFYDVYDDVKWNFAVRIKIDNSPDLAYLSEESARYFLEFYGVSTLLNSKENEFLLSYELDNDIAKAALNSNKRIFLGAEYEHFNQTRISLSDVKIGDVKYWQDYLDNEAILFHSIDPDNYGVKEPYKPAYFNQTSVTSRVPQIDTLCLHWNFATVTKSSSSDGIDEAENILSDSFFYVDDVSAGSITESTDESRYGWLSKIIKTQHTGKGDFYYPDDIKVVDKNYLFAAKKNHPEIIGSSDTIKILTQDDEFFTKNIKPVNYFWAIEKSMYQNISQEIMEIFAGISYFNNLIGEPVNRYRMEYKNLNKLRQIFFQKYIEPPRIEKYIKFYKWIDSSISEIIKQLIPASANFSDDMRTMIESHMLERNKYWNKFPTLEINQRAPEGIILGINEMTYDWEHGYGTDEEEQNCLWWKERADRKEELIASGNEEVDDSKNQILKSITTKNFGKHTERKLSYQYAGERRTYEGQTYVIRSLSSPYRFNIDFQNHLHAGVNNRKSKKIDFVRAETSEESTVSFVETQPLGNSDCLDNQEVNNPLLNTRLNIALEGEGVNGGILSLYELNKELETGKKYWNSNHSDTYGEDKDTPLQGVFTQAHVGGLQSRHISLNAGDDTFANRPEAWNFNDGVFTPLSDEQPKAKYYRDEKAKRPVNIKNIKLNYGNYKFDYQVVQTSSRTKNNRWLIEKEGKDIQEAPTLSSESIIGTYDFKLPDRKRNEHIFVERFSAPGGPDVLSRGMLDVEAEEYAVYNGLNYRNLDVRLLLKDWLTYHAKKWGYASYRRGVALPDCLIEEACNPRSSFHKDHRNTGYRPVVYDDVEVCDSFRDNAFVTHQLPRSDFQYLWIKSSTQDTILEKVGDDLIIHQLCPRGYVTDYPNAKAHHPMIENDPLASINGTSTFSKVILKRDSQGRIITEDGLPFINNFYKLEGQNHPRAYEIINGLYNTCYEYYSSENITGTSIEDIDDSILSLNDIILHRDGPYQMPSWKQIRNNEKKIVSMMRRNNIISNVDVSRIISTRDARNNLITYRENRAQTTTNYIEPIAAWNIPVRSIILTGSSKSTIISSFSNNLENFANPFLERRLELGINEPQAYNFMSERFQGLTHLEYLYIENIYPKHRNVGLNKTRSRVFFDEIKGYNGYDARASHIRKFWAADGLRERTSWNEESDNNHISLNSLGYPIRRSSVWALEYRPRNNENIDLRGDLAWAGDSQYNGYTYDYKSNESSRIEEFDAEDSNSWLAPRARLQFIYNPRSIKAKEKAWLWKAAEISSNTPWHDDYGQYSKDVRLAGQNYSTTPEFNISNHLDFYVNKNAGDFFINNKNIFELPGAFKSNSQSGSFLPASASITSINTDELKTQQNHAAGWEEYFSSKYNTPLSNFIFREGVFVLQEPALIDSEVSNYWMCKDPYPVVNIDDNNKISLSVPFGELNTNFEDGDQISGIKIGLARPFNWNWNSPPDTSELMIERWNNSFMISSWVYLHDSGKNGIFELKADTFTEVENENFISLNGNIVNIREEKEKISNLQTQLLNKTNALDKLNNTETLNSTIANIFEQRRTSYQSEIEQLTIDIERRTENIRNIINAGRPLNEQTNKESLISYLYLEEGIHQSGDLVWEDNLGNKLIFHVKAKELINKWKNICLYYIGGGISNKPTEYRHRVLLFINGIWVASTALNEARMREITGLAESSLGIFKEDGSIFFKNYFPRTITHLTFAKAKDIHLNGKATDLLLFRGNPGLSNVGSLDATNRQHNKPDKYSWFFDHKSDNYYTKSRRLYNSLANKIFKSQCEDANDFYSEWRETMNVCKIVDFAEQIYYDFESLPINILDSDSLPTGQLSDLQDILGNFWDRYINSHLVSGFSLPINNAIPDPSAYLNIPPIFLSYGPFEINQQENEGEQVIPNVNKAACSEMIGWWKLGNLKEEADIRGDYIWNEDFFKCYSHTDKIHYLENVVDQNTNYEIKKLRLEVDVIKKLLPYNGFYPSQRAMQVGSLFYDSVVPYVVGEDDNQANARARTEQAALQPLFAPGILFNTIKSGIAVDWAAYSGKTGNELKEQVYGFVKNSIRIISSIKETVTGFEGTIAQNIINKAVTDDLYKQVSLGNVSTPREVEEFARQSALRNAAQFRDELRTYVTEFDSVQELNRFTGSPFISSLLREDLLVGIPGQTLSNTVSSILDYIDNMVIDFRISNLVDINIDNKDVQRVFDSEGGILNTNPTLRLPFESLVSLNTYLPKMSDQEDSKLFLLAPSYYQENYKNSSLSVRNNERYPYFEWTGQQKPLYEMAMHNFLAEIPNFFLKNNSLTNFKSVPQNQWKHVEEGWTYYLDIHLYKTSDFEMIMSPHNGKDIVIGVDNNGLPLTTHGRYFGPSMRYLPEDADQDLNHLSVADPSQAAYVPPYFYGRAKARLKFKAPSTGQPTVRELLLNLEIDYINEEMEQLFSSRTSGQPLTASQLYLAAIGEVPYKWHDTPAYQSRMPIQSSINFNGIVQESDDFVWTISPKFECPVLNFKTEQNLSYLNKDNQCGTGMWGGYGEIPTSEQGLFLAIEESPVCSSEQPIDYSVLIGIPRDTREANRNIITLKDPTGRIDYIKIGQPSNAIEAVNGRVNFYSWQDKYMNSSIAEILTADNSSEFTPYSSDACIRTIGTSPRATLENLSVGMSGEYDIEAYLQADRYATNIDDLALPATSNVPTSSDLANAIVYHIKMNRLRDRSFPWDARIVWVSSFDGERIRGLSRQRLSEGQDDTEFFRLATSAKVVVEIIYDHERNFLNNRRGRQEIERIIATISPKITLESKTDSLMNPTGKLGIYYIDSQKNIDLTSDDREVEIQRDREFYSRRNLNVCDDKVGSLMDVCGFTSQKSRIGELADSKEISEALVMIPFVDKQILNQTIRIADKNFFMVSDELFSSSLRQEREQSLSGRQVNNIVVDTIEKMRKYNLPPQFDFLKSPTEVNPFVMYIVEFTETLSKQDLSNIWQGLMPEISTKAIKEKKIIQHDMNESNFFEGKELPDNIRWLVFRIKKRANNDYYDMLNGTNLKAVERSYNWPYDYCSLVETCKIKGGVTFTPKVINRSED